MPMGAPRAARGRGGGRTPAWLPRHGGGRIGIAHRRESIPRLLLNAASGGCSRARCHCRRRRHRAVSATAAVGAIARAIAQRRRQPRWATSGATAPRQRIAAFAVAAVAIASANGLWGYMLKGLLGDWAKGL